MSKLTSRIEKLENDTQPEIRQPTYKSISIDEWERLQAGEISPADLGITRPVKVYIGLNPDTDWD